MGMVKKESQEERDTRRTLCAMNSTETSFMCFPLYVLVFVRVSSLFFMKLSHSVPLNVIVRVCVQERTHTRSDVAELRSSWFQTKLNSYTHMLIYRVGSPRPHLTHSHRNGVCTYSYLVGRQVYKCEARPSLFK